MQTQKWASSKRLRRPWKSIHFYHNTQECHVDRERDGGSGISRMSPISVAILATNVPVCFSCHQARTLPQTSMSWEKSPLTDFKLDEGLIPYPYCSLLWWGKELTRTADSFKPLYHNVKALCSFVSWIMGTRNWHPSGSTQSLMLDLNSFPVIRWVFILVL